MRRSAWIAVLCSLWVMAACGGSDDAPPEPDLRQQLTRLVDDEIAAGRLPGAVVAVYRAGEAPLVVERGVANLATGLARSAAHPFRIASISKAVIATAVLTLVDDGRLALDAPLSTWYPTFPNAALITVDDLLRMKSGIADAADTAFLAEYYANPLLALSAEDMIARSAARAAEFEPPGSSVHYNNTNYMLLERIAERVSGTDIRSYLRDHVTGPLGLADTIYPRGPQLESPLHGYSAEGAAGELVDRSVLNPLPAGGAGALVSTVADLERFARALCRGGLLKPATQAARLRTEAFTGGPAIVRYGAGVSTIGRYCGHNGTIFGFSSEMWHLPERDATIVVSVNRLDVDDQSRSTPLFMKTAKLVFPADTDW